MASATIIQKLEEDKFNFDEMKPEDFEKSKINPLNIINHFY
jgi:hypothetical protein